MEDVMKLTNTNHLGFGTGNFLNYGLDGHSSNHSNTVFYINDTQVEHVQIQCMEDFINETCDQYYPKHLGYYLHTNEQSCHGNQHFSELYQNYGSTSSEYQRQIITSSNVPIQYSYNEQVKEGLQYLNILHNNKVETDAPEFIDINQLVPNDYENYLDMTSSSIGQPLKLDKSEESGEIQIDPIGIENENDDVIFVKEYKVDEQKSFEKSDDSGQDKNDDQSNLKFKAGGPGRRRRQKRTFEPRRNPKRQVQLQKASYDLAIKLSLSDYPKRSTYRNSMINNSRRSCRTSGAIFSPPRPLSSFDYKEWPTEGMHERPKYNAQTKTIDKFDFNCPTGPRAQKTTQKARKSLAAKRNLAIARRKRKIYKKEAEVNPQFAQLTHETLLMMIDFTKEIKASNELLFETQNEETEQLTREDIDKNVEKTKKMLVDTSVLYCLANNVPQQDLAAYIDSLLQKDAVSDVTENAEKLCSSDSQ